MNESLMEVFEEMHRLKVENAHLRVLMNEQAVRIDQMLSEGLGVAAGQVVRLTPVRVVMPLNPWQEDRGVWRSEVNRLLTAAVPWKVIKMAPDASDPLSGPRVMYTGWVAAP